MINRKKLKQLSKKALSESDIQGGTKKHIPVYIYNEIYGKSLDDLLKHNAVILLYLTEENYGHFVALYKDGDNILYFDSYGKYPDNPLSWNSIQHNEELGQNKAYLLEKMKNDYVQDKYDFFFNSIPFQSEDLSIQTCGRHAVSFITYCEHNDNPNYEDYKNKLDELIKEYDFKNYDRVVSWLTEHID